VRNFLIAALLVTTAACKGKPEHRPPPQNAGSSAPPAGSGQVAPDLELPKGTGMPPVKTTAPITVEKMQELKNLTFPGFKAEMKQLDAKQGFEVKHLTNDHPKIAATITLQPCFDCLPMDLAKWKERTEALKLFILPALKNQPDTEFEVGQTELNGAPMIYTYQLGYYMGPEGGGYTNAYVLYWNDGVNQARVVADYKDDPATKETMKKLVPKSDLENVAKAFMDTYTHAW
jgi:hypothetical protein